MILKMKIKWAMRLLRVLDYADSEIDYWLRNLIEWRMRVTYNRGRLQEYYLRQLPTDDPVYDYVRKLNDI